MKKTQFLKNRLAKSISAGAALFFFFPALSQNLVPDTLMALRTADNDTRMSLHKNGALYVGGIYTGYAEAIPAEGPGTRLLWYPDKAAFRVGQVTGTQWDDANIGQFSMAAGHDVRSSGDHSTAFGKGSVAAGTSSFAVGEDVVATGAASVAMGFHAHTNARQGSFVFADRSSIEEVRAGVNHSANWRVSGGFRVFTAPNLSMGVTIQSGTGVSNWGQSSAVISTSTGAYLSTSGVWVNASDSNRKHNIRPIGGEEILAKLRRLPITSWSYHNDGNTRHLGPMAQDFRAVFGLGNDEKVIGTVDADGVALAGVQALEARTHKQATELESLKAENKALRDRLDALEKKTGFNTAGLPLYATLILAGASVTGMVLRRRRPGEAKA